MTRTTLLAAGLAAALLAGCGPDKPAAAPTTAPVAVTSPSVATTTTTSSPLPTPTKVVPSTTTAPVADLRSFYTERADWQPCTKTSGDVDFIDLLGFQCATVRVPLDYQHPGGRTLQIGIARLRSAGPHRIGSLVINPGGPGGSGLGYLAYATRALPAAVRDRFDIVGFDPRGVGVSAGLHCLSTAELDRQVAADPVPRTPAQVKAAVARAALLAAGCRRSAGWELPYIGTTSAARDLDLIRSAIGDSLLTYVGKSYGTLLGAVYADEFPGKVRAFVLDGALPPGLDPADEARQQGDGFEGDLRDFLADCLKRDCPFDGTAAQARQQLDAQLARIAAHPLPTQSGRLLHVGEAVAGLSAALYSTSSWSFLRVALSEVTRFGRGSGLLELSDSLAGRHASGYETEISAFPAISCADAPAAYTPVQAAALARRWAVKSPLYGPLEAWGLLACDGWVKTAGPLPKRVTGRGAAPIVVVGTTGDPATPYAWAQNLAHQLSSARLVTYVGDGHTVYGNGRSDCVDAAVNAYLIDRTAPRLGLRCAG